MHTVRDAETNPFTKLRSLAFQVFTFSHSPNVSNMPSIFAISPTSVPSARQTVTSMALPEETVFPSIASMPSIAPEIPMKMTLTPHTAVREFCILCFSWLPHKYPSKPPASIPATLIHTPIRIVPPFFCIDCIT